MLSSLASYPATGDATSWAASTAHVGARGGYLEFKGSIDTTGIFFIARRHLGAVLLHHMGLKVDLRTKHDEFSRLAGRIGTWVM